MITRKHSSQRMSQIVTCNNMIWTAGQVADDASADVAGQTQQILDKIDALLAEAGSDKSHLLNANIWLSDISYFNEMNVVWDAWVDSENPPTRACVESRLASEDLFVEIQVVACLP